jgi:hypothetical protein
MSWGDSLANWVIGHIGDTLTLFGILFAVFSLAVQNARSLAVQKIDLYQSLETNSIGVFKFEAANAEILEKFQDTILDERKFNDVVREDGSVAPQFSALQARYGSMQNFVDSHYTRLEANKGEIDDEVAKQQFETYEQQRLITRKFYEQTLNLFEMATRFRNKGIIEPEVFGSWVIWFYDTLIQWGFRDQWPDLRQNYTPDLRRVFNRFIAEFDAAENAQERKHRFFQHVASITRCSVIRNWLSELDREAEHFNMWKRQTR